MPKTTHTINPAKQAATKPANKESFSLPKVFGKRASFLPQPSEATELAAAICQGYKISGEIPHYLKKDPKVQSAALEKFSVFVTRATSKYFENWLSQDPSTPRDSYVALTPEFQKVSVQGALDFANKYDLTKFSKKEVISIIVDNLNDYLQRMNHQTASCFVNHTISIARKLGVDKEVISHPVIQRRALETVAEAIRSSFDVTTDQSKYAEHAEKVAKFANLFRLDRYSKKEFLDLLSENLNGSSQRLGTWKRADLFSSFTYMAERLGLEAEFIGRRDVKKCGLYSIKEHLRYFVSSMTSDGAQKNASDIGVIAEKLKLPPKAMEKMLQQAHHEVVQLKQGHNQQTMTTALQYIGNLFNIKLQNA